jgi:hypothetical protein
MHDAQGWLPTATTAWMVLGVFGVVVIAHALWRSRGSASPDPIRESGPIF